MKTIIWKELRENLKWAALAFLCLLLAEISTLNQQREGSMDPYNNLTLCSFAFLLVTAFGCSAIGAALGALQIVPELRRDQWAALLHRPISRTAIFFGKVSAGLLLYLLATALPLLASVAYVATPGEFAGPLVPGMILPAASDIFLGMAFYFAALLVSLTRGPWYARRGILGLSILPVFVLHMTIGWIFLIPVGASFLLMVAACGMMMSNGLVKESPKAARLSYAFLLFSGVEAIVLLVSWGLSLLPWATGHTSSGSIYRDYKITTEGDVFMETNNGDGSIDRLTDVNGKLITDERYIGNNGYSAFCQFVPICWNMNSDRRMEDAFAPKSPRELRNYVKIANGNAGAGPEHWYTLVGQNYFVGYDRLSRRRIGICDSRGFHPAGATPAPFPLSLESANWNSTLPLLYWSEAQVYGFDFAERSMTTLLKAQSDKIHGAEGLRPGYGNAVYVGVALDKRIQILDLHGTPVVSIPYGYDRSIWSGIWLATIPAADRIFVKYEPVGDEDASNSKKAEKRIIVDEVDLHGKVLHSYDKGTRGSFSFEPGWGDRVASCALPLVPAALGKVSSLVFPKKESIYGYESSPTFLSDISLPILALLCGISVALGIGAYVWARKVGIAREKARGWAVFVFCFGLPGFITFRLAADWPVRVKCPQCSRKRSIGAEECPGCRKAWAAAERNGTEIFDNLISGGPNAMAERAS